MRTSNAIESQLTFRSMLEDDAHRTANSLLRSGGLARLLDDSEFRRYLFRSTKKLPIDGMPNEYAEFNESAILLGNSFELIGGMVRNKIVPEALFLQNYWWVVVNQWERLEGWIALLREYSGSQGMYEDFEFLTVLSRQWSSKHPDSYARSVPHIPLTNRFPLQAESWLHEQP
ncbi:MAG TPA: DUF4760 domain-containing protein [Candidatus Baltobacteraceae bacterium]|nr:DUF4760 domain-containing protein [Candidatus Baltobacteraceae bacterium]